jgi:hypothetical protein
MSLQTKYPINNWILSRNGCQIGDKVAYWDSDTQSERQGSITAFTLNAHEIVVKLDSQYWFQNDQEITLDFYQTIIYKINKEIPDNDNSCSCGAKHTSNPNFHLKYCALNKKS